MFNRSRTLIASTFALVALAAAALAPTSASANPYYWHHGYGWGWGWGAAAAGLAAGAIIAAEAQPYYYGGCWVTRPVRNPWGYVVGYRRVYVC